MIKNLPILLCFTLFIGDYHPVQAAFVNISGCPSLYLYDLTKNQTTPPCFCDNATSADDPPVQVNCFIQSTFDNLTQALNSVQKSGKKLSQVNIEYMTFDDAIGIPDNYFRRFGQSLSEITIVGCRNDRLPLNYTFSGLEKSLKKLTISGCTMLTVPPSIANLSALESLTLEDTYIYTISKDDFRGLKNLKYFNLVGNQIYYLEKGAFDDLRNVETAVFGPRNSINETALGELNKLTSAKTLILYNNYFHALPDNSFKGLQKLQLLDLQTNYIENITIDSFAGLSNLTTLKLDQNVLKRIDDGSFHDQKNLRELSMEANYMEDIWPETFRGLDSLEELNLNWNNFYVLDKSTFSFMPRLKSLNVRKAVNLQYLDPEAFDGLGDLRMLNLSQSNLTTIDPGMLQPIGLTLETLDVSGTNIYYLSPDSFQYGARLKNLSLANTPLYTVPIGSFSYLTHLQYLDLTDIKWICDDQLSWLVTWLKEQTAHSNLTLINSDQVSCWEPLELRNKPLLSLDPNTLRPYVAPIEIDQPERASTALWTPLTTVASSNSSNQPTTVATVTSAPTTKIAPLVDASAVKDTSDSGDSKKIKIVIAIVASIVTVATIAVIAIVVLIMRRRKRKQNAQNGGRSNKTAATVQAAPVPRPKTIDETEMTMRHASVTNEPVRNRHEPLNGQQRTVENDEIHESHHVSQSSTQPPHPDPVHPNHRPKSTNSEEV